MRPTTHAMRRTTLLIAAMVAAVLLASGAAFSQSAPVGDSTSSSVSQGLCQGMPPTFAAPDLPVMTRNLYLGADLDPVVEAARTGPPEDVFAAVSKAWAMIKSTHFPKRAELLADEIEQNKPMLVGLQEVSLYRTGKFQDPTPATHEEFNYLDLLLGELNDRGMHYAPVAVTQNYDAEFAGFTSPGVAQDIRLTDRDVILARTDLPKSQLKVSNARAANFATNASFPIGNSGQSFTLYRGWGSVDAKVEDGTFRFINTHLEPESTNPAVNEIQVAQGNEILSGPANTNLPVILAGDFNSRADEEGTDTYRNLIDAGFADAWSVTHPGEPGYTWAHQEDLRNEEPNLTRRLDLVLFRDGRSEDGLCAVGADIVGDEPLLDPNDPNNAFGPLWPSDHAGVVATLRVE